MSNVGGEVRFVYTLMTEQSGPRELVGYASGAERAGFDFAVSSDHYFPWLQEQGHAGMPGACWARSPRSPRRSS